MRILGIETSCDETAAAVVDGGRVLSNVVSSQAELHGEFYGVVPELASRAHQEKIGGVIEEAVARAAPGAGLGDLGGVVDAVAFTQGPGLAGALLVGKVAAQALAEASGLPLCGVNHLEGHALAVELERKAPFPFVSLIVSGGHTDLALLLAPGRYRVLGRTRDDAAGEVFDKVAKLLGLGYPGGPAVDRAARGGDPASVAFPRPLLPGTWDFSFSGLKTAVLYHVERARGAARALPEAGSAGVCAAFQEAVVDTLVEKTLAAAAEFRVRCVVVGGGVAANSRLRAAFAARSRDRGVEALFPAPALCTDNAAMIAHVASYKFHKSRPPRAISAPPTSGGPTIGPRRRKRPPSFSIDPAMPMRSWA